MMLEKIVDENKLYELNNEIQSLIYYHKKAETKNERKQLNELYSQKLNEYMILQNRYRTYLRK